MITQVRILTITTFILITAETGPVGPSFKAKKTENSAPRKKAPCTSPNYKFSLLKSKLKGMFITYSAASKTTRAAQIKSARKLSLITERAESILVQYLAIFIRKASISIEQNPSVTIICNAFELLSSYVSNPEPPSLSCETEKASIMIPDMQTRDPVKSSVVSFSLYIK